LAPTRCSTSTGAATTATSRARPTSPAGARPTSAPPPLARSGAPDLASGGGAPDLASGGGAPHLPSGGGAPDLASTCKPNCVNRTCGPDGCGGTCGSCPQNQLCNSAGTCQAQATSPIQIDGTPGAPIHPEIYGMAFAPPSVLTALRIPVNRWGGNGTTLYNWQLDVHNTGNDWYFENIVDDANDGYGTANYNSAADQLVSSSKGAGAAALITIPTIGWTPKDRVVNHPFTCSYPVSKYGAQKSVDPYDTNCGNGVTSGGATITPDPTIAATMAPASFEQGWLTHLVGKFGTAQAGGVRYYQLDNEMMLWNSTHADVHPKPVSYDEVWQTTSTYAPVIRAADPSATILGYTSWGVLDLFNSGLDSANNSTADQMAHGGLPLAEWYLSQLAAYEKQNGKRLVDCLDLHYYPQGGDPLQNTRSLWDPTYHDPSWIDQWLGQPVDLFPRLQSWIAAKYPGTSICVSEYNFELNNESDPKSALVEADVLGIYGKYGVRLAAYWTTPTDSNGNLLPPAEAFRLFRNYDGAGGQFGGTSIGAATSLANVAVYGATDGNSLTVLVINKGSGALATTLGISNFTAAASAHVYQYVAQSGAKLTKMADVAVNNGQIAVSMPALSMQLLVIPK
jgi:hypothetical protein